MSIIDVVVENNCKYEENCSNYNPFSHIPNGVCLNDQCPSNDYDCYDNTDIKNGE